MAHSALSHLDDWHLVHPEQDIRGWNIVDGNGASLGRIEELLVDTDSEIVEAVRTDKGIEYPAHDIEIGDGVVHMRGALVGGTSAAGLTESRTEPIVKTYRDTRIQRRSTGAVTGSTSGATAGMTSAGMPLTPETSGTPLTTPAYDAYEADFRSHYNTSFGTTGQDFNYYEPGYRFGYTAATGDRYRNREYTDIEPDLRREYETKYGAGTWDRIRDAARHAYHRGRH